MTQMSHKSISQLTSEVLKKKPFVNYGLDEGIINISALAEKLRDEIEKEAGEKVQVEAIKTAIRRYIQVRKKPVNPLEIYEILRGSRLLLRNNIGMLVTTYAAYPKILEFQKRIKSNDYFNVIQQTTGIVLMMDEYNLREAEKLLERQNILEKKGNLAAIVIVSSIKIESVKGFVTFVFGLLAYNGINMEDAMSSYTDTTIIVKREDAIKSFELLESIMK